MVSSKQPASGYGRCPICRAKAELAFRPFCSKRCRDIDLARWLGDGYAIPGGLQDSDEDGEEPGSGELGQRRGENDAG